MNISKEIKEKVVEAMKERRPHYASDAKFAVALGISSSQYSRVMRGDWERVLSDSNWISIARKLEVTLNALPEWKAAATPVYEFVTGQLQLCH